MSTGSRSLPGRGTVSRRGFLRVGGGVVAATALPSVLTACSGSSGGSGKVRIVGVADEQKPITDLLAVYRKSHPDTAFSTSFAPTDQVQTVVRTQLMRRQRP